MRFTRDTDYIAQEVRKDLDQGQFPYWEQKNSEVFLGVYTLVYKDLIHDFERWCAETRYAHAVLHCTPKLTVPHVEFLDRLNLKLGRQLYRMPYDAGLPIIADEELEEWGCTTETLGKSLQLVPDYENVYKEGRRRLPLNWINQMELFKEFPSILKPIKK